MKSFRVFSSALLAAALLPALPLHAQGLMTAPIVVKSGSTRTSTATVRGNWLRAEVIHADSNSMVVREQNNGMMIHTFTYTPQLQAVMQKIMDAGGYQYGDKVSILYQQGQTVAMRLRGRPSKPI